VQSPPAAAPAVDNEAAELRQQISQLEQEIITLRQDMQNEAKEPKEINTNCTVCVRSFRVYLREV